MDNPSSTPEPQAADDRRRLRQYVDQIASVVNELAGRLQHMRDETQRRRNEFLQVLEEHERAQQELDSDLQLVQDELHKLGSESERALAMLEHMEHIERLRYRQELEPRLEEMKLRLTGSDYLEKQNLVSSSTREQLEAMRRLLAERGSLAEAQLKLSLAISAWHESGTFGRTGQLPDEISVVVYLDTDSEVDIARVVQRTDELVEALGYEGPLEPIAERGSFFRRSWARIKQVVVTPETKEIAAKAGRALEIHYLGAEQADIDQKVADAQAKLIDSLADIPSACIRAGSILLIKHPGPNGPVLFARNLSQLEIKVLEKFPEIQRTPQTALEALALAISEVREAEPQQHQP